jgi:hypothetical protein
MLIKILCNKLLLGRASQLVSCTEPSRAGSLFSRATKIGSARARSERRAGSSGAELLRARASSSSSSFFQPYPWLTDPRPPRLVVSSGHARGASIPLHWFKKFPSAFYRGPEEAHYRRMLQFALSTPGNRHPRSMTCGPGPPCHRLSCCLLRRK